MRMHQIILRTDSDWQAAHQHFRIVSSLWQQAFLPCCRAEGDARRAADAKQALCDRYQQEAAQATAALTAVKADQLRSTSPPPLAFLVALLWLYFHGRLPGLLNRATLFRALTN